MELRPGTASPWQGLPIAYHEAASFKEPALIFDGEGALGTTTHCAPQA